MARVASGSVVAPRQGSCAHACHPNLHSCSLSRTPASSTPPALLPPSPTPSPSPCSYFFHKGQSVGKPGWAAPGRGGLVLGGARVDRAGRCLVLWRLAGGWQLGQAVGALQGSAEPRPRLPPPMHGRPRTRVPGQPLACRGREQRWQPLPDRAHVRAASWVGSGGWTLSRQMSAPPPLLLHLAAQGSSAAFAPCPLAPTRPLAPPPSFSCAGT